jgi:hypothetical protein
MGSTMRKLWIVPVLVVASWLAAVAPAQAKTPAQPAAPAYGTVTGTVKTEAKVLLNGMCVNLYKGSYAEGDPITTAPTGTGGLRGFFSQPNVPVGSYVALFYNCGANIGGAVNPNYVDIFHGNTYVPADATKFTVAKNATTALGVNLIPLGGTISGTVTDSTLGGPAVYSPPVGILIPGAYNLNLGSTEGWYIACANSKGKYAIHGVPTGGVNVVFAPTSWGCVYNSKGDYNFGFYDQSESVKIDVTADGTKTVNGSVTEGPDYPSSGSR